MNCEPCWLLCMEKIQLHVMVTPTSHLTKYHDFRFMNTAPCPPVSGVYRKNRWGTELKIADTVQVDMGQLGRDVSLDLLAGADRQFEVAQMELLHPQQQCDHPLTDRPRLVLAAIEEDTIMGQDVCIPHAVQEGNVHRTPTPTESEDVRVSKLFPNSFKISGIKHVCDNALSSILSSLPRYPTWICTFFCASMMFWYVMWILFNVFFIVHFQL